LLVRLKTNTQTPGWNEPSLIEIILLALEEKIFFFKINTCKYGVLYCGPIRPPRTMMWTILNLHYIRKLSYKYELFYLSSLWEDFKITPLQICIFFYYLPFEKDLAPDLYNSKFPLPKYDLY
jgi:hypothetical protein